MNTARELPGKVELRYRLERPSFTLDVELSIPMRGITGIFGESGSGKTTLLRCIAGLEDPVIGQLAFDRESWEDSTRNLCRNIQERQIGYVFQEARLFDHLSVSGNLHYGRKRSGERSPAISLEHTIELLALESLLSRKPQELSGGEAQRVAIGRALLRGPRLILMDEPLAALDRPRREEILPFLDRLHAELSIPIIFVSHNIEEICRLCDFLVILERGRAIAAGELQTVLTNPALKLFDSQDAGTVLEGEVTGFDAKYGLSELDFSGGTLRIPGRFDSGQRLRLRIRADDISLCRSKPEDTTILNILPVTIAQIHKTSGPFAQLQVVCGNDLLAVRLTRRSCEELDIREGHELLAQIKSVAVRHD